MLSSVTTHYVNRTEKDIIPPLYLSVDCCESIEDKVQLNELHLDIPPKAQFVHEHKLNLVHHKIDKLQEVIDEHEWQLKHSNQTRHLSIISLVGSALLAILISILCCCCCRPCYRKCWHMMFRAVFWVILPCKMTALNIILAAVRT
jgi:hypothetical protein